MVHKVGKDKGQSTPGQNRAQTLVATRTDQAIESHGGEMVEARAQLHIELAMGGQQGVAGHLGSHLAIAEDDVEIDGDGAVVSRLCGCCGP